MHTYIFANRTCVSKKLYLPWVLDCADAAAAAAERHAAADIELAAACPAMFAV